ncbi:MAG: hypothetical protein Kow0031_11960 [Anaerolineae bacterium]
MLPLWQMRQIRAAALAVQRGRPAAGGGSPAKHKPKAPNLWRLAKPISVITRRQAVSPCPANSGRAAKF